MIKHTIYALVDPHTSQVRYVGRTGARKPRRRLDEHVYAARGHSEKPLHAWIRSLRDKPIFVILQEVEYELGHGNSPQAAETKWIKRFRRTILNANLRHNAARIWDRLTNHGE